MEAPPPQINTARLRPFRQRIHRTVMTITGNGCVSMEIMCRHANQPNSQEIVKELFRVSPDGRSVEVYQNQEGVSAQDGCPRPGQAFKLYTYPDLPSKQLKKYQHAYKFVELVKSRTAKVVLITDSAQCKLMENSEPADFKADFYNGSSVVISKSTVSVTDRAGGTLIFDSQSVSQHINPDTLGFVQTAYLCHHKCLEIERHVRALHTTGVCSGMFPIVIGSSSNPYHITPVCEGEQALDTAQPNYSTGELRQSEGSNPQPGAVIGHMTGQSWTCGSPHGTPGQSICSEAELCRLLDGQLSEFGGSSRPSSLKTVSRSGTPQTQSSTSQCGDITDVSTYSLYQQFPSNLLSGPDMISMGHLQQPDSLHNYSTASCTQLSAHATKDSSSTVSSSSPQNSECIETNTSPSRWSFASPLSHDFVYSQSQTDSVDCLDCSLRSSLHEFSTPSKNSTSCQKQEQDSSHLHSISNSHPLMNQLGDEKAQLLLEHQHSLITIQPQSRERGLSVRRALDMDLSLPISSPVPISGSHALQQDLLAIQPTPSLDLSDCSDRPDAGRQHEEDQFLEFPNFRHLHQSASESDNRGVHLLHQSASESDNQGVHLLHQSDSDKFLEEFNSSLSFSVDPVDPCLSDTKTREEEETSALAKSHPGMARKAFEQTVLSNETLSADGIISSQANLLHNSSNLQSVSEDIPRILLPLHQDISCSFQASKQPESANPPLSMQSSFPQSSAETPQQGFTRPRLYLGLNNNHKGSNSNTQTINSATGCSNSSNNSSNTSSSLDLMSPQPTCVHSSLPPHLRHSLDMSASSHYSDSSAPSSSCAGDVVRQLFVPYTGWASLHATGAVWILYNDGTQIGIKSTEPAMIYVDQDSTEIRYSNADSVPEIVRLKLEKLPSIVDQLMRAPVTPSAAQLSRPGPGGSHKV